MKKTQISKKKYGLRKIVMGLLVVILLIMGGFTIYTMDYYEADPEVRTLVNRENDRIQNNGDYTSVYPNPGQDRNIGLIFYPGGKVEAIAYLPLLKQLSDMGITCVLTEMPFNLAVFNQDVADQVYPLFPDIDDWFLAGHSLGGAMASSYVDHSSVDLKGLILLGAYPINDADLPTLAIYGTEDIKLDLTKMRLAEEVVIDGGNHAYFGNYGEQEGDGLASISREDQQTIAVKAMIQFIEKIE